MTEKRNGFTLVELAIVLMIIGLLIGGILKGQELIANARVTSLARFVQSVDAATTTFRDSYGAMPGDMASPSTRLPNCSATPCSTDGNGDGRIGTNMIAYNVITEALNFWLHLGVANLLSGVNTGGTTVFDILPPTPVGGSVRMGYRLTAANSAAANTAAGHWLSILGVNAGGTAYSSLVGTLTATQMASLDRKMDDGYPRMGSVQVFSNDISTPGIPTDNGTAVCHADPGSGPWIYNIVDSAPNCRPMFLLQQ